VQRAVCVRERKLHSYVSTREEAGSASRGSYTAMCLSRKLHSYVSSRGSYTAMCLRELEALLASLSHTADIHRSATHLLDATHLVDGTHICVCQ